MASSPCARTPQTQSSQISGPNREEWHTHSPLARDFHLCAWTMPRTCPPPPAAARRNPLQFHSAVQPPYRARSRRRALDPSTMRSRGAFRKQPVGESVPASPFHPPLAGILLLPAEELISASSCRSVVHPDRSESIAALKRGRLRGTLKTQSWRTISGKAREFLFD